VIFLCMMEQVFTVHRLCDKSALWFY
jgi:hypothetical protein